MTHDELYALATRHGRDAAENYWVTDPAEPEQAREWIRTAEAGSLHDYILPSPFDDFMPSDLNTEGWSWGELADYEGYWVGAYLERTTELMRGKLAEVCDCDGLEDDLKAEGYTCYKCYQKDAE